MIPPALVRRTFVMLYKGPRDNFGNYRAIGLMCHSYKLLSMLVLHRMQDAVESRLAETQTCFRRERGCRDNVLLLRLLMDPVLRPGSKRWSRVLDSCRNTAQDTPHSEGLDRIFRLHDIAGQGIGGPSLGDVTASKLEYADDVGLLDWMATEASELVSALASGSRTSASMEMAAPKSKGMHVHVSTKVEVEALDLPHSCPEC